MADISSLRPLRYNPETLPDPGRVIAPPYDVISPERRRELLAADPHNVIQLILPEGEGDARYDHAAELFDRWRSEGILIREEQEALYPYSQCFTHPMTGDRITRRGFICRLRLVPFEEGVVLPHERTLSGPKADRLKLTMAVDANLEPIFGMFPDAEGEALASIDEAMGASPLIDVRDADGVEHRLWRAGGSELLDTLRSHLASTPVFIVDGHHRYETGLAYRRHLESEGKARPEADWIMIFLVPSSDPGLVILPTHRIVSNLPSFSFEELLGSLERRFTITPCGDIAQGAAELARTERLSLLLASGGDCRIITLDEGVDLAELLPETPVPLRDLDVTILHDLVFDRLLGMDRASQAAQANLSYVKSLGDAVAAAGNPETQLVAVMNPTRLDQVESVAAAGEVMPQKSTYFYPKLASGLLFSLLS